MLDKIMHIKNALFRADFQNQLIEKIIVFDNLYDDMEFWYAGCTTLEVDYNNDCRDEINKEES